MNLNRDEFLLLSRTGRGPQSTRAGPVPEPVEGSGGRRLFRRRKTSALSPAAGTTAGARHALGPRMRGPQRPSRTPGSPDERTYHELEFLVGFPVEEETLL
ncbi:MAG TPA: hypothetical protein VGH67_17280 [Solirubrobacteraceae bacterium]|jgi:hypothetical protein